jgi:2-iminobutanoate/2-iminopropanoate deaminase
VSHILFHMIDDAPEPVAPFSHATEIDGWIFITGQMPTYPGNPQASVPEGIEAQTHLVIDNLSRVLEGLSLRLGDVVRSGAYLTHFADDYAVFNRIYAGYFESGRLPARTCIGVTALARGARVEIDFIARRPAASRHSRWP